MKTVAGFYYSNDHEWVKVEGDKAYVGITDYAQHALGKIVYVELPEMDADYQAGDIFCVVESVKAASDSTCPVSGKVVEINEELESSPQLLNDDPYENWIMAIELADKGELNDLMDEAAYQEFCDKEE